jgi:hypothetical protein
MPPIRQSGIIRGAPYFLVPDVSTAGAYYQETLGFQCEYAAGHPPEFAIYSRGGAPIMLRRAPEPSLVSPNEKQGGTLAG